MVWSFVAVVCQQLVFATQNFPFPSKSLPTLLASVSPFLLSAWWLGIASLSVPLSLMAWATTEPSPWPRNLVQECSCDPNQSNPNEVHVFSGTLRQRQRCSLRSMWDEETEPQRLMAAIWGSWEMKQLTECIRERETRPPECHWAPESTLFWSKKQLTLLFYQLWVGFSVTSSWEKILINISSFGLWLTPNAMP